MKEISEALLSDIYGGSITYAIISHGVSLICAAPINAILTLPDVVDETLYLFFADVPIFMYFL